MHTASQLPGILRWFEVVETESITLNPIEAAIDTMDNKNKELRQLVAQYSTECAPNDLNPLTMRLNGNIDAAVGGGIAKYQEAFFSDDYIKQNPEYAPHIARLRALFLEQVEYFHFQQFTGRIKNCSNLYMSICSSMPAFWNIYFKSSCNTGSNPGRSTVTTQSTCTN